MRTTCASLRQNGVTSGDARGAHQHTHANHFRGGGGRADGSDDDDDVGGRARVRRFLTIHLHAPLVIAQCPRPRLRIPLARALERVSWQLCLYDGLVDSMRSSD